MMQKTNYRFPEVFQRCNTLKMNRLVASLKDEITNSIFLHYLTNIQLKFKCIVQ